MLKSTYQPAPVSAQTPLPPGWTEHKAPTGHTYYYNADTKVSTYTRPILEPEPQPRPQVPQLSDPRVANAYIAQFNPPPEAHRAGRGGHDSRPKPQPIDRPVRKEAIPGHEPWILVYTKYSRRFVYNPAKSASYWRIPEKLMPGILELDKRRIREKAEGPAQGGNEGTERLQGDDNSEYEEVEVTEDEEEGDDIDGEHRAKRQRTEDPNADEEAAMEKEEEEEEPQGPVEFTEDDIAMQLAAMGEEYGLEPGDYDDGQMETWEEGTGGIDFSEEDAKLLFRDLLEDYRVNPFTSWDMIVEQGKILEDPRYTALNTTKARKECWDEWSREKIARQKEERAKLEKKDPKIGYIAFLGDKASPKLYWPEFKRKYKREDAMKDVKLSDKDREKLYREHVSRLKMPQAKLKSDLTSLLKDQPLHLLNSATDLSALPTPVLTNISFISLPAAARDPLITAYIQTLPPPPDSTSAQQAEEDEARKRDKEQRAKREKALQERNKALDEEKKRREFDIRKGKERLREAEREVEEATRVGKGGLKSQLLP